MRATGLQWHERHRRHPCGPHVRSRSHRSAPSSRRPVMRGLLNTSNVGLGGVRSLRRSGGGGGDGFGAGTRIQARPKSAVGSRSQSGADGNTWSTRHRHRSRPKSASGGARHDNSAHAEVQGSVGYSVSVEKMTSNSYMQTPSGEAHTKYRDSGTDDRVELHQVNPLKTSSRRTWISNRSSRTLI